MTRLFRLSIKVFLSSFASKEQILCNRFLLRSQSQLTTEFPDHPCKKVQKKSSDFFCPQGAASQALWYLVIWNSFLGPVPLCGRNKWDEMHFHEQTHCTMMEGLPNLLYSPSSFFLSWEKCRTSLKTRGIPHTPFWYVHILQTRIRLIINFFGLMLNVYF